MFYIDSRGRYCEGDCIDADYQETPRKPSPLHDWSGTAWVLPARDSDAVRDAQAVLQWTDAQVDEVYSAADLSQY